MAQRQGSEPRANSKEETVLLLTRQSCKEWRREPSSAQEETEGAGGEEQAKEETLGERVDTQEHRQRNERMANTTAAAPFNFPEAEPLSHMAMQVQEVYPFHDGWNVACFIILLLFILTVISLAALAVLYELLDCGCCAKGKTHLQLQAEGPGSCSRLMSGMCKPPDSHTEIV